jgi:hypothetical protein
MNKNNWSDRVGSDNDEITVGEIAKSIVITANALGIEGFSNLSYTCADVSNFSPFVKHLKLGGFLVSGANSNDILTYGQMCDLLWRVIMLGGNPYTISKVRADRNQVISANASPRSSIVNIYESVGYLNQNGKRLATYILDGLYDPAIGGRQITGSEKVTRAIFAKLLTGVYEFKHSPSQSIGFTRRPSY